ncbi:MAG: integrase family protein [Bacteroidetes bacterium]|nr:integrase family protein [Bacteroidota bacterium]
MASKNRKTKITKTQVDRFPTPSKNPTFLRDTSLQGFAVKAYPTGSKIFVIEKRINGKVRRITLGPYGVLTVEQARREAQKMLGKIAEGIDPIAEKEKKQILSTTLWQAFEEFRKARKHLKPRTLYDYELVIKSKLKDWKDKPLASINRKMVSVRHQELGEKGSKNYADLTMRALRSIINFAQARYTDDEGYPLIKDNPVTVLTLTRAWNPKKRRQTVIKPHQLPAWFEAVYDLKKPENQESFHIVADFLLVLLFTGLRRQEAAQLKWKNIDLKDRTLLIPDPKNHEPLTLPLSDFLIDLLSERKELAVNGYVFPGRDGKGYLIEPKRQIQKVIEQSNVQFTIHDLRRTFMTIAESLDISFYAIKRLVNHKMKDDVTAGYIISDIDRLRGPMQRITDSLLEFSNKDKPKKEIMLEGGRKKTVRRKRALEVV